MDYTTLVNELRTLGVAASAEKLKRLETPTGGCSHPIDFGRGLSGWSQLDQGWYFVTFHLKRGETTLSAQRGYAATRPLQAIVTEALAALLAMEKNPDKAEYARSSNCVLDYNVY